MLSALLVLPLFSDVAQYNIFWQSNMVSECLMIAGCGSTNYQLRIRLALLWRTSKKFADTIKAVFMFKNETLGFEGTGTIKGKIEGDVINMFGIIKDNIQGSTFIIMQGHLQDGIMEGSFTQQSLNHKMSGAFVFVRLSHTSYLGGIRSHQITKGGQAIIDLGISSQGLLGPGRADVYGPGLHSDATGRPFTWRTDNGQVAFGRIKENAYGLGVGMDQFGRPVRAKPLW